MPFMGGVAKSLGCTVSQVPSRGWRDWRGINSPERFVSLLIRPKTCGGWYCDWYHSRYGGGARFHYRLIIQPFRAIGGAFLCTNSVPTLRTFSVPIHPFLQKVYKFFTIESRGWGSIHTNQKNKNISKKQKHSKTHSLRNIPKQTFSKNISRNILKTQTHYQTHYQKLFLFLPPLFFISMQETSKNAKYQDQKNIRVLFSQIHYQKNNP